MCAYKLSIITPLLAMDDHAKELSSSLDQLRSLGLLFEHVVVSPVDEGSVKAVFEHSTYVVEHPETRGVFDAVAQGFEYAIKRFSPSHLSYINADDLLFADFKGMVGTSKENPESLITGNVNWIGEKGDVFGPVSVWPFTILSMSLFERGLPPFTQQGLIFPVSCWLDVGGFDKRYKYIADSVFWHKALSLGLKRHHFNKSVAGYRLRIGQLSGNRSRVSAESLQWHAELENTIGAKFCRWIAMIFARSFFMRRYLSRVLKRQVLRSEKATVAGGFTR